MLKIVFYIVLAIPVIYVTAYAVLFVVAAAMYRTGRLTKADLDRATWEYQKEKARKKSEKKAKKEAKMAARRLRRQSSGMDTCLMGDSTFMWS